MSFAGCQRRRPEGAPSLHSYPRDARIRGDPRPRFAGHRSHPGSRSRQEGRDRRWPDRIPDRPTSAADAKRYASYARSYGASVTEIYSPYATWTKVKNAAQGANILIYLGHGNGYPSPYGSFQRYTKDGFGLNATSGNGNSNVKYWGEYYIDRDIQMAPNAVVILARLCYASGNSEWGSRQPDEVDGDQARRQLRGGLPPGRCEGRLRRGHHRRPLHHQEPVHVEPQHARDLLRLPQPDDEYRFRFSSSRTSWADRLGWIPTGRGATTAR